jgi:hypothetical protein
MTIDRTWYNALVNDDGSGTTGSVLDKSDLDDLLDTIDAMVTDWTAVTYNAANFTASAGTWTVDAGDQITYRWSLVNKTMHLRVTLTNTTVSAPASLRVAIPGGHTSLAVVESVIRVKNNGTDAFGLAYCGAAAATVAIYATPAYGTFAAGTNNTDVSIDISFEVT